MLTFVFDHVHTVVCFISFFCVIAYQSFLYIIHPSFPYHNTESVSIQALPGPPRGDLAGCIIPLHMCLPEFRQVRWPAQGPTAATSLCSLCTCIMLLGWSLCTCTVSLIKGGPHPPSLFLSSALVSRGHTLPSLPPINPP